jgi:hypothetical protein
MFGINTKKSRRSLATFSVLSALAIGSVATSAQAAVTAPTSVGIIEYYGGTLLVQLNGVNFYGQLATQAACTTNNQTIDTLKAWQSLAQAALLSGKQLKIYYNVCGSTNYITAMDLNQ